MRVLALVTDAFGAGGRGGIAHYNRHLFAALAGDGAESRVVVLPRHGRVETSEVPPRVMQLPARRNKFRYALASLRTAITDGPFDAIFCGHLHMAPLGAILSRMTGIPLWLQLHGLEAWQALSRTQRSAVRHARLVTAVSRHTRRRFLRFADLDPARVRVLPNTFDQTFVPGPKPDHLLDRYQLRDKQVLLTVGRLAADEQRKGHDQVIRALAGMASADLVYLVVGEGSDRARLAGLARTLKIADRVLFLGDVPSAELVDHYRLADVFVMPSTQEGFGIVFLEAAASGCKVVGGDRDGSIDALADGALGIAIDPASVDEVARAIADALAGQAVDCTQVRRFANTNFVRHVHVLSTVFAR
jgi:phosphatidylinositol alpha-1,6-mannosyltransferase